MALTASGIAQDCEISRYKELRWLKRQLARDNWQEIKDAPTGNLYQEQTGKSRLIRT